MKDSIFQSTGASSSVVGGVASGGSMFETVAVFEPVFPAVSTNSKVKFPFCVKVCWFELLLLVIVADSLVVIVAVTDCLVGLVFEYDTVAVGAIASM